MADSSCVMDEMANVNNYLITESEVVTAKFQTEALPKVNTARPRLRFCCNYQTVKVIKMFIIWLTEQF